MMKNILFIAFLFIGLTTLAQPYAGKDGIKPIQPKAASCSPPKTTTTMAINNVRIVVHTAGNLWQDFPQNKSIYEVPKNSGIMALFTAALWLGGTDANGQLKLAALRYRDGQDYWTGPLSNGFAETSADICLKYDRHFITTQDEVKQFVSWYKAGEEDALNGTNTQGTLFPDYQVPKIIKEWPAHGDESLGQDYYLAPFWDYNEDGHYNYEDGDYPWHDIYKEKDCQVDRRVSLYGDLNYWWIMNDKGNIHSETGADPIGMEIRAQAFAFATGDEINNMTFYNYELINRGSLTLFNTYFGFFTDGALGGPFDDYVGCDVNRGLGYYYNGNNYDADAQGFKGYGFNPPAIGVDFFEGPFQDDDGIDNAFGIGLNEALNGIGYGDNIIDNERFGMRRFLYYSNTTNGAHPSQTDPISAPDYYNYLRGFWKDGTPFYYGGSGHITSPGADPGTPCEFMFPGDTDPLGWGTGGVPQPLWTEQTAGNTPNDRRFVESAGPFVLKPGAVNNITVGVVFARSTAGDPFASVEAVRRADDKAQALFENCFRIIDSPNAPDVSFQELENEVIIYLSNPNLSNNYLEQYKEFDPFIVTDVPNADKFYRFQGYQIFQLVNPAVSISELDDPAQARLVGQCDIKDSVTRLVNFVYDNQIQADIPTEKVNGENKGIRHSFQITEDAFAIGDRRLVNFKRYYYVAIAYAYNNYKQFIPGDIIGYNGQKIPYLRSRKAAFGEIKPIEVIPHSPVPEAGGTNQLANYGETPKITRLDGHGNGGRILEFTTETEDYIVKNGFATEPEYMAGKGPINIKVVDPLNLADGYFELAFDEASSGSGPPELNKWKINRYDKKDGVLLETLNADQTINVDNEQLVPQWGISVQIVQESYFKEQGITGNITTETTSILSSEILFSDSSKRWLRGVADVDGYSPLNWIRSGSVAETLFVAANLYNNPACYPDEVNRDPGRRWSGILGGTLAPHSMVGYQCDFMPLAYFKTTPSYPNSAETSPGLSRTSAGLAFSPSIDIVITKDKSKWTKCIVLELGRDASLNQGGAKPGAMRKSPSKNINGDTIAGSKGQSWFPGYAIDLETGARLHMAFGENSFLGSDGGGDMIWNPGNRVFDQVGNPKLGGMQPIYVFSHKQKEINGIPTGGYDMGYYDGNTHNIDELVNLMMQTETGAGQAKSNFYSSLSWIGYPLLAPDRNTFDIETDVRIKVRLNKEYKKFVATGKNGSKPMYSWNMGELSTKTDDKERLVEALDRINVVPNPYYGYSQYERDKLDTRLKITNLPEVCSIQIYTANGRLVKSFKKSSVITYQDWELKNEEEVPVASGVYLIVVQVPDVGNKILKLFLGSRQADLNGL